jgi:hypothetical protein
MTPFERAARFYSDQDRLTEVVEAHFLHGYVISTPEIFVVARRVVSLWPDEMLADIRRVDPDGDCWHVELFAGDMEAVLAAMPFPLPFVSFHRRDRSAKVYPLERVRGRILFAAPK